MKLLIITGGSGGIGGACAAMFLASGWHVINISRRVAQVSGVHNLQCDIAQPGFTAALGPQLIPDLTTATQICLLHNAALLENDRTGSLDDAAFRRILEINLVAPNALNSLVLPYMKPGSSIIYVGSTLSEKAVPNSLSYVTSKHGLMGMMRATTQDLIGREIHTALVCPGFTDTQMLRTHVGDSAAALRSIAGLSTFGRLISSDEIAATVHFVAGNPVLNGAVIHANLGQIEH